MRKKLLVGNWKMNKTPVDAVDFATKSVEMVDYATKNNIDVGIAPTYLCLASLKEHASNNLIVLAQNVHFKDSGAYTGEVSCDMLNSIGVVGSIIGHSERRTYDNETSSKCNLKIKALLAKNLIPLYCVGETEEEFVANKTYEVIEKQLVEGLANLSTDEMKKVVIAYEPVWSIGTGRNASKEIAQDICGYIREVVKELYSAEVADKVIIQYGGSVKPENSYDYLTCPDIDGVLVGGASLKPESFEALVSAIMKG